MNTPRILQYLSRFVNITTSRPVILRVFVQFIACQEQNSHNTKKQNQNRNAQRNHIYIYNCFSNS